MILISLHLVICVKSRLINDVRFLECRYKNVNSRFLSLISFKRMEVENELVINNKNQSRIYDSSKNSLHLEMINQKHEFYKMNATLNLQNLIEKIENEMEYNNLFNANQYLNELLETFSFNRGNYFFNFTNNSHFNLSGWYISRQKFYWI